MGVSVSKEGPYFNGGVAPSNTTNMKFSQMRDVFKLDLKSSSATGGAATSVIKASELRRNTNNNERDPYVPDCVINEDIAGTGQNNWKVSQMRNSIKRFWATQSGTETYFRMGRYDPSDGKGIDWGGYGGSGRDSTSSSNGNLTKNVQKFIKIEGTCGANDSGSWGGQNNDPGAGSWTPGTPAAQLSPQVPARNIRIWVYGSILGAGGEGGYDSRGGVFGGTQNGADPGTPGGTALKIDHSGNNTEVVIKSSSARVYGGGGGGEQGMNGQIPKAGECWRTWTTSGCGTAPGCSPGTQVGSPWQGSCCNEGEWCWSRWGIKIGCNEHCYGWTQYRKCEQIVTSTLPTQGIGGRGGNGRGYNLGRSDGQNGTNPSPKCPTCPPGYTLGGNSNDPGVCTTAGQRGGDGGDWGQNGASTTANNAMHQPQPSNGGKAGKAICGSNFTVSGTINGNTIKGSYSGQCDGSTTVVACNSPVVSMSSSGSGPYTISWSISNSPHTVSGGSNPSDGSWNPSGSSGSITVNPTNTTIYSITAINNCGVNSKTLTIGVAPPTWAISRSASWKNQLTFNKFQGSGQSQIIATNNVDGTTVYETITASAGAKYRMRHRSGSNSSGWWDDANDADNLSEGNQVQSPVFKLTSSTNLRVEDGSNDPEGNPDGRTWIDLGVDASSGAFSVDGQTDWPIHIDNLHSANNSRSTWLQNGTNDQRIEFWDGDGQDPNGWFEISSKDSSITEAKFVDGGRKLRIKGGGNITLLAGWNDRTNMAGVSFNEIELWNVTWTRNGTTGDETNTFAICGGDIIYTV